MNFSNPFTFSGRNWSFDSLARWSLFVTLFLAAVMVLPIASAPFVTTKVFILAIGAVITTIFYVLGRLTSGGISIPPLPLLLAIWAVPLAYGLSTLFSSTPFSVAILGSGFALDTFGFMVLISALATLAALAFRKESHYKTFLHAAAWLYAVVMVVQVIFFIISRVSPATINPAISLIGSPQDIAIFAGLGIILSLLAFRFGTYTQNTRYVCAALGILSLFFLAITNDTVTWTLVGLVAFGLLVEAVMHRSGSADESDTQDESFVVADVANQDESAYQHIEVFEDPSSSSSARGVHVVAPIFVLVAAVFFLIGSAPVSGGLANLVHASTTTVRPSWQSTVSVGQQTYASSALFGSGPNTFKEQLLLFRNANVNLTPFWNTDFVTGIGVIPTSFVTTGVVGVIAWFILFGVLGFFGIRALLFREAEDPTARITAVIAFIGAAYILFEMIFSVPGPFVIVLGFVLIGIFASTLRTFEPQKERTIFFVQNPRTGFAIAFALTLILLFSVMSAYAVTGNYIAQVNILRAENALAAGNTSAAASAASQSIAAAQTAIAYRLQSAANLTEINKVVRATAATSTKGTTAPTARLQALFARALSAAQSAIRMNPRGYENWLALGNVYASAVPLGVPNAYNEAKKAYEHAAKLNPTSPLVSFTTARIAIANKSYKDAATSLKKTVLLKQNYMPAILELAQVDALLGKAKDALKAAESAAYFLPNNPAILFQVGVLRLETNDTNGAIQALSQAVALNKKYANAHYFLAVAYATKGKYAAARTEIQAIAALSSKNAKAVAPVLAELKKDKNPFVRHHVGTPLPSARLKK